MALYKLTKTTNLKTGEKETTHVTKDLGNGAQLEFRTDSTDNADSLEYQEWVKAGNTPEAAD